MRPAPLTHTLLKGDKRVEDAVELLYSLGPRSIRNRVGVMRRGMFGDSPTRYWYCLSSSLSQNGWGFCLPASNAAIFGIPLFSSPPPHCFTLSPVSLGVFRQCWQCYATSASDARDGYQSRPGANTKAPPHVVDFGARIARRSSPLTQHVVLP